ncbi:MAG: GNAT family N-acetyltransferase [Tessaracoccus sp.]|uniref:GNAT family N-acetyltransferase n=1 Tax=Tessaracoccus sp. TaxID=1971211 RepID=UPI001ED648D9|nr:GNAT family N-acetyltransferase [Tessaracoccus sp.]MBK7821673.1 GNAT family N-acetyltransferase [Tessaracoccus sp.]
MTIIPAPGLDATRVSIRRRRPSGALSDVVGHLVAANDEWMVVLPEDRGAEWVPRAEAEAVRKVPERTVLPASPADALQRVVDLTWPGLRRARLGGWTIRTGRGRTQRANSVLAVGDPGMPFLEAVAAANDWAGTQLLLQAVVGSRVAEEALALGWRAASPTVVMVADAASLSSSSPTDAAPEDALSEQLASAGSAPAVLVDSPDEEWLAVYRGGDVDADRLAEITAAPARYLRVGDQAVGRVALARGWAVLSCVEVSPDARGEGLGRAVTRALAVEAHRLGARYLALQVEDDNVVARGLYASEGYVEHHTYAYLSPGRVVVP